MRIVETFDVFEHGRLRFGMGSEVTSIEQLAFETRKEALRHRVHKSSQLHASRLIERRFSRSLTLSIHFSGKSSCCWIGATPGERIASIFTIALAS